MLDISLPIPALAQVLMRLLGAAIASGILGWAAAWLAGRLGDPGPGYDGRNSPSPFVHVDLVALLHAVFYLVPWIRPLDIDRSAIKAGWLGRLSLVLGSCAVLAAASALGLGLRRVAIGLMHGTAGLTTSTVLTAFSDIAIVAALFNLLPAPPFLGALLLPLSEKGAKTVAKPLVFGLACALVIALSLVGVTGRIVSAVLPTWRSLLGY